MQYFVLFLSDLTCKLISGPSKPLENTKIKIILFYLTKLMKPNLRTQNIEGTSPSIKRSMIASVKPLLLQSGLLAANKYFVLI